MWTAAQPPRACALSSPSLHPDTFSHESLRERATKHAHTHDTFRQGGAAAVFTRACLSSFIHAPRRFTRIAESPNRPLSPSLCPFPPFE